MRDLFFTELRKLTDEIRDIELSGDRERINIGRKRLSSAIEEVMRLNKLGHKEGLLALEEAALAYEEDESHLGYKHLKKMFMLIVDGIDPEQIEEICTAQYFAAHFQDYEGLQYLMFLTGALAVQAGENYRVIEERLLALVPDPLADEFRRQREEATQKENAGIEKAMEIIYDREAAGQYEDGSYFLIRITENIIQKLDDRGIRRMLRETDKRDLELMLRVVRVECRHRIFDNFSEQMRTVIAEDIYAMEPVTMKAVTEATYKIFNVLMKLILCDEIKCADEDIIKAFANLLGYTQ